MPKDGITEKWEKFFSLWIVGLPWGSRTHVMIY